MKWLFIKYLFWPAQWQRKQHLNGILTMLSLHLNSHIVVVSHHVSVGISILVSNYN